MDDWRRAGGLIVVMERERHPLGKSVVVEGCCSSGSLFLLMHWNRRRDVMGCSDG